MVFKIIIVEDDKEIREELTILLQNSGYEVKAIAEFENVAEKILENQPHLVLLDINLPNKSGYEICSKIRSKSKVPIIFVTSRNNSMDELKGIMLGGDDYIEKPYNVPILLARIQSLLNRIYANENKESVLEYKGIELNLLKSTVRFEGKELELTKNEVKTLHYFFSNKDKIIARADIIDFLWDNGVYADDNSLSVIVTRLRDKLKDIGVDDLIETRRGQGYKI
jgi:two-component system response regulator protein BraR/BceR